MPYFSRLTDIVTCNLTELLKDAANPREALEEVLKEMRQGMTGAERSAATAARSLEKVENEITEQTAQVSYWLDAARKHLGDGREDQARNDLMRKKEVEALIAGLEQQRHAARATRDHLQTTFAALRARYVDAERRLQGLPGPAADPASAKQPAASSASDWNEIDKELAALRKQLNNPD